METYLDKSPFAKQVGYVVAEDFKGNAEGSLALTPVHFNENGTVHGGCLFTLMDSTAGVAAQAFGKVNTAYENTNFMRPVRTLQTLTSRASTLKAGRKLVVVEVEVFDEDERVVAKSTITYYILAPAGA